jgi:hypothetical protein
LRVSKSGGRRDDSWSDPLKRGRRAAGLAAVGAATAVLFVVSKGKWSDALIDSGREWIVPDALARGEVLYRDVVYWFGPFTPYFQAAFLRIFGSGFASLIIAGAVSAAGVLAAFFLVLRRAAGRLGALLWTALALPALVFMPNAGGALLGMGYRIWHAAGFTLAAVAIVVRGARSRRQVWMLAAGACAGLAGLCRTEWGLAAAAGAALASVVRSRRRAAGVADAFGVAAGYAVVFACGLGLFLWKAGAGPVVGDGHVLLTGLPPETRHFLLAFSGLPDWRSGVLELVYSAAMWTGIALVAGLASGASAAGRDRLLRILAAVFGVLAATALLGGAGGAVLFSAGPLVCLAGVVAGLRRGRGSQAAVLAACGALGLVLSYRRPFHIGDSAYVGPPLLFAFVCAAGLLRIAVAVRAGAGPRRRLAVAFAGTVAALVVVAFGGRAWQYATLEAVPVPGTADMLSAEPGLAREIAALGGAIRAATRTGDGLAVFPEGEVLNFLSGRPNPVRHKLYLPGYLTAGNEAAVLHELERARPAAVVLWRRPVSEYDRGLFGEDYGRSIRRWIAENYRLEPFRAPGTPVRATPRFVLGIAR